MGLFLDLLHVPVAVTNDALEGIYKALSDGHDHGDDGIWKPHPSPLIRRLIELFTKRGLDRLASVHEQLLAWQAGSKHVASAAEIPTPPGMMTRWSRAELSLVKIYLESLPVAKWTLDDHMMAVDYVVQTYLPADALATEAEWLATRAGLMGKVQANMDAAPTLKQADVILAGLPSTVAQASTAFSLSRSHAAAMDFARVRCAEQVRALSEDVRHRMRTIVAADLEQKAFGAIPAGTSSLETKLSDAFATLNRDWRRIAVTEAGEAQLQGFIASLKPGARVKRIERYDGACAFCRKIDGVVATVVTADGPNKDPDTMVWPGKNNIGRSASPRKRVGDVLVEREPDEMWWLPAGLAHPHCRGRWVLQPGDEPGDDPVFAAELRSILGS
jgi:hypothetical protein